jgi:hypothetical protein
MTRPAADLPRVYLCREPVDFRKGMRSLAVLVEQALGHDPFANSRLGHDFVGLAHACCLLGWPWDSLHKNPGGDCRA